MRVLDRGKVSELLLKSVLTMDNVTKLHKAASRKQHDANGNAIVAYEDGAVASVYSSVDSAARFLGVTKNGVKAALEYGIEVNGKTLKRMCISADNKGYHLYKDGVYVDTFMTQLSLCQHFKVSAQSILNLLNECGNLYKKGYKVKLTN